MDFINDYFAYRDELGNYGYASKDFYSGAENLLEDLTILLQGLTESVAKKRVDALEFWR